jgi:beta-lactam-binding protein with PASTA domain
VAPASGSKFTGWSGDCSGIGVCLLTMTANRSVTAGFAKVPMCHVPKVKGLKLRTARVRIRQANCSVGRIRRKRSWPWNIGYVIKQSPGWGAVRPAGSPVNLVVGRL